MLQNREKRMLSNMVPHKLKIRKLTKGQKNEIMILRLAMVLSLYI